MKGTVTEPWGKLAGQPHDPDFEWHPLRHHCTDVAAVCEALLNRTLIADRLARLAGLDGLSDLQKARLVVLCFLHDLGKTNTLFQHKVFPGQPSGGHVAELVAHVERCDEWLLEALAPVLAWADDDDEHDTIARILLAAVCHHGRPVANASRSEAAWKAGRAYDPTREARRLVGLARELFPEAWAPSKERLPNTAAFQHAFSGLVMLADWLGSDRKLFPYSTDLGVDRLAFARQAAADQLLAMGLDPQPARAALPESVHFEGAIGFEARHAQKVLANLPLHPKTPTTVLLEAETGAGKTEAAFFHYLRLLHAGAVDGLYFALPTRTAATQIEDRLTKLLARLYPDQQSRPPLVLAVPGYLRVDGKDGVRLPGFEVLWNDNEAERFRARAWAAENTKRYLAGAVVVGTIDQVLFSTLQVGHAHLRSTALMRHLLVVDEVHASDAYMNRILTKVLERHRDAGGHALLMSATLGSATAGQLLGEPPRKDAPPRLDLPFPLVTERVGARPSKQHVVAGTDRTKTVHHTLHPWLDEDDGELAPLVKAVVEAAMAGARVLVLRNTVKAAIATQRALEAVAPAELLFRCAGQATLHHSRFAPADRKALDHQIQAALGKDAPRKGLVVVATQTVQQSLDLNADLMWTDLCPMDVLLQRLGRLHRHDTLRPDGFETPRCGVLVPAERDLGQRVRGSGEVRALHGLGNIYEDLRVLEATWRELESHDRLVIPKMNRALVEATTTPSVLAAIAQQHPAFETHEAKVEGGHIAQRQAADLNLVDWTAPFGEAQFMTEDRRVTSRLGDSDLRIVLDDQPRGPFGQVIDELSMPHFLAFGFTPEAGQEVRVVTHPITNGFAFTLGETLYHYDRLGLRRADATHEEHDHVGA